MSNLTTNDILQRLAVWVFIALVGFITIAALFADIGRVQTLIATISFASLASIITSVLFNYSLRFMKWTYFLHRLRIKISFADSLWTFFSAFTMVLSPGKLGEIIKSVIIKSRYGIPISHTAPIVMAERITDLLGLICLAAIGSSRFAFGGHTLVIASIFMIGGIAIMTRPGFWRACDRHIFSRFASLTRFRSSLHAIEESTGNLLSTRSLIFTVPLSAVSWAGEGVALYFIFGALGVTRPELLGISLFAHAFSSIVGALSFLPGGLLVTEGTLGMFFVFVGIGRDQAVSATLLIRTVTLWFAVILGTVVFLAGRRPTDLIAFSSGRDTQKT
ncbi:MAG: flippase-like domain-containing protein [Candidatus Riflebacteria bacterium]|nr:flippase-like domain-containing protein [Candidatus Riflebacteria bacterium]